MPTRLAAALLGVWMTGLAAAFLMAPALQPVLRPIAGLSAAAAIVLGLRRHRPTAPAPWRLLIAVVLMSAVAADLFRIRGTDLAESRPWLFVTGVLVLLVSYPVLALALALFVRRRTAATRDRGAVLDALTVSTGLALLGWTFVIRPHLHQFGAGMPEVFWSLAFPAGDLICLALLVRLLAGAAPSAEATKLVGGGVAVLLVSDVGVHLAPLNDLVLQMAGLSRLLFYLAVGLAALHPSMTEMTRPAVTSADDLSRLRLVLLALASLVAPAVLLVEVHTAGRVTDLSVIAVLSAVTFLLVLTRMAGIMTSHRLALARERALRRASATLVAAPGTDEVAEAVRAAVAQLLPADVRHRVVLSMAITESEEVPTGATAARAAADRAGGTTARIVPTREVEWVAAVRLNQFSTVLRCPLVLGDRPAGDPLVGVLTVGAPAWMLSGLRSSVEVLATQVALALERIELSQEVARRNSETYFRTLVMNTSDVILIVDEVDQIRYASPSAVAVLGRDPVGVSLPEIIHPVDQRRLSDVLGAVRAGDGPSDGMDFRALGAHRTEVTLELHCRDLRADQSVAGLVVTLRDVTERRRLERELTHQAFHDSLTGLANRVLFTDRLEHALARAARDGSVVGVLFIDLDDFKIVNDTLGHAVGDELLMAVADRIGGALRADDTAARLGGDEFAALVENVQDPGAVEETATRILAALAEPIVVDGEELHAVASIGITTTPEANTATELLRQADLALYVAKGAGKGQWRRYQSELHGAMVERLELRSALEHSVKEGQFILQYQPIVDLATDDTAGFEALVRWDHPTRGIITPDQFIEVAEESGLIVPIGRWVLDEALRTVAQWRRLLPRSRAPYVSVNVSVRQFRAPGFVDHVRTALQHAGVPPQALMLEITETLLMGDEERIWAELSALQEMGVRVAIDDFGTGYSSLGYLRQRPIDVLKIDKTFVDDMVDNSQQAALVSGIISLAQTLNLTVVAEGIETATHRDMLLRLGCPLGQGFLFSTPVGATEALHWLTGPAAVAA
ncbi:putative bifunctional diguanylate cyclase/phosphodiesterase [Mangrovihabitans endophyticus]|uniref:PAS domain S-box-containing protein/diguanylate cyclase (GGDEF) domain-containing protein n=1 Tax=Mangrovihabitans endophyticus TaxID=1751298 RepID=A0A8J3C483_9ACTN|nr:EAL domain-containing protein [Mangrovihabitans endophyticus]GGL06203.1 hypothetical protein GCM10012284_45600 [Mangrovihabitans endophyticus]